MSKRRKHNWPQLFEEFEQSGLSQVAFCKQREINVKYFSLKRSRQQALETSAFAKAIVKPDAMMNHGLILEVGSCKVYCPNSMPLPSFISLVRSLA